jgi:hypothetical protein
VSFNALMSILVANSLYYSSERLASETHSTSWRGRRSARAKRSALAFGQEGGGDTKEIVAYNRSSESSFMIDLPTKH